MPRGPPELNTSLLQSLYSKYFQSKPEADKAPALASTTTHLETAETENLSHGEEWKTAANVQMCCFICCSDSQPDLNNQLNAHTRARDKILFANLFHISGFY